MKQLKTILSLSLVAFLSLSLTIACQSNEDASTADNNTTTTEDTDTSKIPTRSLTKSIKTKAYHYKNLASFAHGQAKLNLDDLASLEGKLVNLVVLYDASAPWANNFNEGNYETTGSDHLNGLLESYLLEITQQFAIDDDNEGLVLEATKAIENPVEAARELSLVDHVLMVHVKEVPAEDPATMTVDK